MARRRAPAKQKKISGRAYFVLGLFIALCAMGFAYFHQGNDTQTADTKISSLDKPADDGKNADYTAAAEDLQDGVITWLKSKDCTVETVQTENREETRHKTGGKIIWSTKSVVAKGADIFTKETLTEELRKSDGKATLYRTADTTIGGASVKEYDIALFDLLDTEQVYLIALKVFVPADAAFDTVVAALKKDGKNAVSEKDKGSRKKGGRHPSRVEGRLAVVIDDCGSDMDVLAAYNAVPVDLTYAVMPFKAHTIDSAESGYNAGRKIIVHLPMEPLNVPSSEEIFLSSDMGDSKITATTNELIDQVPYAVGINNHQGSKATADVRLMKDVMSVLKRRGLVFLDSRTSTESVGAQTAAAMGVPTTRNNLFLDNDPSVPAVKERLRQAARIAKKNGSAVAIGHCRAGTMRALRDMAAEMIDDGIDFVFVTDLM